MKVTEYAYAKINLYLDVISRRDDGFHNVLSVMHSVGLCDELTLTARQSSATVIILRVLSEEQIPSGPDNLVYKAVEQYLLASGITARVDIKLKKNIPVGAGLGGGSTDAAAALRAMNRIFGAQDTEQLLRLALSIGSDVPYCLLGGTYICEGRGEPTRRLDIQPLNFVVVLGKDRLTAKDGYAALDLLYSDFGGTVQKSTLSQSELYAAFSNGNPAPSCLYNVFEKVDLDGVKRALKVREALLELGASAARMSGSGPAVFGIFETKNAAETAFDKIKSLGYDAYLTSSV